MTTITDLKQCHLLSSEAAVVAIGWLGATSEFQTGEVESDFFDKLVQLCAAPWQPFSSAGLHECELCQFQRPSFGANLFVPQDGKIFAAPVGVVHYIAAHRYRPPDAFIEAVRKCPPMGSMEYKRALLANGGRTLVQATS